MTMGAKNTNWALKIQLDIKETAGKINIDLLRGFLLDMASEIERQSKEIADLTSALSDTVKKEVELESHIVKLEGKIAALKKTTVSE